MNENDYRAVLGDRIKSTRRKKFKTVDAARQEAAVARGTWEKAEKGLPIKDFSLAAIEEALGWPEGYAQSILDGKEAGLAEVLDEEPRPIPRAGGVDAYLASIEDRLDDLEARMAILENPLLTQRIANRRMMAVAQDNQRILAREKELREAREAQEGSKAARNPGRRGSRAAEDPVSDPDV